MLSKYSLLWILIAALPSALFAGGPWTQESALTISGGESGDQFGWAVSLDGNTAVVGAPGKTVGSNVYQGAAYVYVHSGATWTLQQELTAVDGVAVDQFGWSVAASGDTIVVGDRRKTVGSNASQGNAYVFVRNGTTWTQQQELTASDGAAGDEFGWSVGLSGDTAVVGAWQKQIDANSQQGAAYVFVRNGTTWTQQQKLVAADGSEGDEFGLAIAVDGNTVAVGSDFKQVGSNAKQGTAYVFVRNGTVWTQQQELTSADGAAGDEFGNSLAISANTLVVGAHLKAIGLNSQQGAAYVFVRSTNSWTQQQELIASDGADSDFFGGSVSVSGDTALVGAYFKTIDDVGGQAAAYVYSRNGANWAQQQEMTASDGAENDEFGWSVAVSGYVSLIGARDKNIGANVFEGAAYIFRTTAPTAAPPVIAKVFGAPGIAAGASTSLTFTITNPVSNAIALSGVAFNDMFPAGMQAGNPSGLTNTCGGVATASANSVTLSGAVIPANSSCTVVLSVTATTSGTNTVTVTSDNGGTGNTASATLSVTTLIALPPTLTQAFADSQLELLGPGNNTTLRFTLANPNAGVVLSGISFDDILPAGLIVSSPANSTTSCSGASIIAAPGSQTMGLSGAILDPGASCTFSLSVTATMTGIQVNTTGGVVANTGMLVGMPAAATISVVSMFMGFFR